MSVRRSHISSASVLVVVVARVTGQHQPPDLDVEHDVYVPPQKHSDM